MQRVDVQRIIKLLGAFPGTKVDKIAATMDATETQVPISSDASLYLHLLGEMTLAKQVQRTFRPRGEA